MKELYNMAT